MICVQNIFANITLSKSDYFLPYKELLSNLSDLLSFVNKLQISRENNFTLRAGGRSSLHPNKEKLLLYLSDCKWDPPDKELSSLNLLFLPRPEIRDAHELTARTRHFLMLRTGTQIRNLNTVKKFANRTKPNSSSKWTETVGWSSPLISWLCLVITEDEHVNERLFVVGKSNQKAAGAWLAQDDTRSQHWSLESPDSWLPEEDICSYTSVLGQLCCITGEEAFHQYSWHSLNSLNTLKCLRYLHIAPWPCLTTR